MGEFSSLLAWKILLNFVKYVNFQNLLEQFFQLFRIHFRPAADVGDVVAALEGVAEMLHNAVQWVEHVLLAALDSLNFWDLIFCNFKIKFLIFHDF